MVQRPDRLELIRQAITGLLHQDGPDLTGRQLAVLLICGLESQPVAFGALAPRIGLNSRAIAQILNQLEKLGLARRIDHPSDGRMVLAEATEQGRAFVQRVAAAMQPAASGSGSRDG
jgi:DNA-binding MarR family transcriptional regulator